MADQINNEKESLSRIREILFGDQIAELEQKLKDLEQKQKEDFEKLIKDLNTLVDDTESLVNSKIEEVKEELTSNLKKVEFLGVKKSELAAILKQIAEDLEQNIDE